MGLLDSWWNLGLAAWFALIVYIYDWFRNKLNYFERRNILHVKYNIKTLFKAAKSGANIDENLDELYKWYMDARYVGFYRDLEPSYLIRDPNLVNVVTKTSFFNFHDRWYYGADEEVDPLIANLFNLSGDKWQELRYKLNPAFTSSKLSLMFPLMQGCANTLAQRLRKSNPNPEQDVDVKELFSSYTFGTLASCGFGIEPESIKDPECEFRKMMRQIINISPLKTVVHIIMMSKPLLASLMRSTPKNVQDYFISVTRCEMRNRQNQRVQKQDFVKLLSQVKEIGGIEPDAAEPTDDLIQPPTQRCLYWTEGLMSGQMLTFFQEGYETTSLLLAITAYHLSKNFKIQENVRRELREAKKRHGTLTNQALMNVPLLDHCILESLRLFPPKGMLIRICTEDFVLDDGTVIEKDSNVVIPVMSLQRDASYWPKPEVYDPERFSRNKVIPGTFLPFGQGPRACIGEKLALLMSKVVLAKILINFQLSSSSKTSEPLKRGKYFDSNIPGGLWIKLQAIDLSTV